jgi:aryl-alcohol dehydrogenase-like predicted oxidoreductase
MSEDANFQLKKRRLGRTDLMVSEIGLGTWGIGGREYGQVDEESGMGVVEAYLDQGGNLIDTARCYDQSEELIGRVLKERGGREDLVIVSKTVNTEREDQLALIRKDLETSLGLLGTDYLDVYLVHEPPEDPWMVEKVLNVFLKLREEGLVRHIGASIKGADVTDDTVRMCRQYLATGQFEVFEVIYSVLRQKIAYDGILEEFHQAAVGVIGRTALESGFLTGAYPKGYSFEETDHRLRWKGQELDAILESIDRLEFALSDEIPNMGDLAIRFVLDKPHLSTTIIGATTPDHVKQNLRAAALPSIPKETYAKLLEFGLGQTEKYNTSKT